MFLKIFRRNFRKKLSLCNVLSCQSRTMSLYEKIRARENPYSGTFCAVRGNSSKTGLNKRTLTCFFLNLFGLEGLSFNPICHGGSDRQNPINLVFSDFKVYEITTRLAKVGVASPSQSEV